MTVKQGTGALVKQLGDEIIKRLDESYDLVYVDYRDQLTDTQVSKLVRGDEWVDESWEFESESKWASAKEIIDDLAGKIVREWGEEVGTDVEFIADALKDDADEWDRIRYEVEERDTGEWVKRLVSLTPKVLLRINVIDEDHAYNSEKVTARRALKDVGLRATRENVKTMDSVLAECSPEYSVLLGYWIVGAAVSDIAKLPVDPEAEVEIVNPYLYLGNPFAGSGFISERPLQGTVRVKREDLRTDEDAFGYPVDEVYGGLRPSDFEAEIRPVEITTPPEE